MSMYVYDQEIDEKWLLQSKHDIYCLFICLLHWMLNKSVEQLAAKWHFTEFQFLFSLSMKIGRKKQLFHEESPSSRRDYLDQWRRSARWCARRDARCRSIVRLIISTAAQTDALMLMLGTRDAADTASTNQLIGWTIQVGITVAATVRWRIFRAAASAGWARRHWGIDSALAILLVITTTNGATRCRTATAAIVHR